MYYSIVLWRWLRPRDLLSWLRDHLADVPSGAESYSAKISSLYLTVNVRTPGARSNVLTWLSFGESPPSGH